MAKQFHDRQQVEDFFKEFGFIPTVTEITSADLTTLRSNILAGISQPPVVGQRYKLKDGLLSGRIVEWDGINAFNNASKTTLTLVSKNGATEVAKFNSANASSDTVSTVLEEIVIPGFLLGKQSKLRFLPIWGITNSASTKTVTIHLYTAGTGEVVIASNAATTVAYMNHLHELRCQDSFSSQKTSNQVGNGNTGNPLLATTANFLSDVTVRFKASWGAAVASETISLAGYSIELLP